MTDHSKTSQDLRTALAWYGEQARLARLIHSGGDPGRHALAEDGGKRAAAALATPPRPDHAGGVERCGYTECAALGRTICEDCRGLTPDQAPPQAAEREGLTERDVEAPIYEAFARYVGNADERASDFRMFATGYHAALAPTPTGTEASRGVGADVGQRIGSPHYVDAVGSILIGVIGSAAAKHGGKITADGLIGPQEFWDALHPRLNAEIETYMARAMDEDRRRAATPTQAEAQAQKGAIASTEARNAAWYEYRVGTPDNRGPGWNDPSPASAWNAAWKACKAHMASAPIAAPVRDDGHSKDFQLMLVRIIQRHRNGRDLTETLKGAEDLLKRKGSLSPFRSEVPAPVGDVRADAQTQEGGE